MDADCRTVKLDAKVEFSSSITKAISDITGRKGVLQETLDRILQTFHYINSKRRGPEGKITLFSVNIGDKGRVKLIRVKATISGVEREVIAIDLPEA